MFEIFGSGKANFVFDAEPILRRAGKVGKNFKRAVLAYTLLVFFPLIACLTVSVAIMKIVRSPYLKIHFKDGKFRAVHRV